MTCGLIACLLPGCATRQDQSIRAARTMIPLSGQWQFATGSMKSHPGNFDATVTVHAVERQHC
jgi:hypothetical protein